MVYLVNSPLITAPQARNFLRFRGYLKGKIWLCYNSYRDAQKRSGPDFPNVNYGVKFLKFDSEQFLDFQKDFKEKIFRIFQKNQRKNIIDFQKKSKKKYKKNQ